MKNVVSYKSGRLKLTIIIFSSMIDFQMVATVVNYNAPHPYVTIKSESLSGQSVFCTCRSKLKSFERWSPKIVFP